MESTKLGERHIFSRIKWFFERLLDFKRKSYPLSAIGAKLVGASIFISPLSTFCVRIILPPEVAFLGAEWTRNEMTWMTFILSFAPMLIGSYMIFWELKAFARNTARVLISGLPGVSIDFPENILSKSEHRKAREVVVLSVDNDTEKQVERYNAEVCVDLFKRFVLHDKCEKLYIGGLARIPFLVAYGALLRNASNIFYFDKIHSTDSWRLLNDEDLDIKLCDTKLLAEPNETGDIGIALGLSTEIHKAQLPISLQNSTNFISTEIKLVRNLILNQENLKRISGSLLKSIDFLSAKHNVKKIHFFLSVQSTLAIELGRRYQEGTHKPWVIHNFDGKTGKYAWSLELSSDGVIFQEHKPY